MALTYVRASPHASAQNGRVIVLLLSAAFSLDAAELLEGLLMALLAAVWAMFFAWQRSR
jgi:hypothetical protein